jgi:hypothetical protein
MDWQPIEVYDALKVKPKMAVFRFEPVPSKNGRGLSLPEHFEMKRTFGSRVCTHFVELPQIQK